MRSSGVRTLGGLALVIALLIGTGAGVFHVGQAFANTGVRRLDMLAAGVDMTPIGTSRQIERMKRARLQRP